MYLKESKNDNINNFIQNQAQHKRRILYVYSFLCKYPLQKHDEQAYLTGSQQFMWLLLLFTELYFCLTNIFYSLKQDYILLNYLPLWYLFCSSLAEMKLWNLLLYPNGFLVGWLFFSATWTDNVGLGTNKTKWSLSWHNRSDSILTRISPWSEVSSLTGRL